MRRGGLLGIAAPFLLGRWLGKRFARQLIIGARWAWKLWAVLLTLAAVRWGPDALTGVYLSWVTWVLTGHSRSPLVVPRWPRWTIPLAWSGLMTGTVLSILWNPVGPLWVTLGALLLSLRVFSHRGMQLRQIWREAGYGAAALAAWHASPWRWWRARMLGAGVLVLLLGALVGWPRLAALLCVVSLAILVRRWLPAAAVVDAIADQLDGMQTALTGALRDQRTGWDADLGPAPVAVAAVDPVDPARVAVLGAPLPASWEMASLGSLDNEVKARLRPYGEWLTVPQPAVRTVELRRVEPLPTRVEWDGRADLSRIWLGTARVPATASLTDPSAVAGSHTAAFWEPVKAPHLLVIGPTGAGKSVAARAVIGQWTRAVDQDGRPGSATLLDPKRVEFVRWRRRPNVLGVAVELEEMAAAVAEVVAEMEQRYRVMARMEVEHIDDLPPELRPARHLLVVDEAAELLDVEGIDDDQEKAVRKTIKRGLLGVARLGRAAGEHLVILAQRPDASILSGQLRHNLGGRLLCGPAEGRAVQMVYGDVPVPAVTPGVRGRARWASVGESPRELQGLWVSSGDMDRWCPRDRPGVPGDADRWMRGLGDDPVVTAPDDREPAPAVATI